MTYPKLYGIFATKGHHSSSRLAGHFYSRVLVDNITFFCSLWQNLDLILSFLMWNWSRPDVLFAYLMMIYLYISLIDVNVKTIISLSSFRPWYLEVDTTSYHVLLTKSQIYCWPRDGKRLLKFWEIGYGRV